MDIKKLLIIVIVLAMLFCASKTNKKEKFASISDKEIEMKILDSFISLDIPNLIENQIKKQDIPKLVEKEVKKAFKVDLDAIRNLSEVSKKLQSGGLTIPGNLKVTGNLTVDKDAAVMNNLYVKDYMSSKRLDIRNNESVKGRHHTHFNYNNSGVNYFRGPSQVDQGGFTTNGQMTTKNIKANGNIHIGGSTHTNGSSTVDGQLQVNKGIGVKHDLQFNGGNNWILHTPDDNRHILYFTPSSTYGKTNWNWHKGTQFMPHGGIATHKLRPMHHCNWVDHGCVSRSLDSAGATYGDVVPMKWNQGTHHHQGGFISHERRTDAHLYERGTQLHGSYFSHRREHNGHGHMRR